MKIEEKLLRSFKIEVFKAYNKNKKNRSDGYHQLKYYENRGKHYDMYMTIP